jgi:NADPH:quinone reductase-like Zn-dependent oxidoreductase
MKAVICAKYRLFAFTGHKMSTHAEYITVEEKDRITVKPDNLNFGQSAALSFGGITALFFLRMKERQKILIYGTRGA